MVGTEIVQTPIQRTSHVNRCQALLQVSEINPVNFSDSFVIGDESWIHHYDPLSQLEAKIWNRSEVNKHQLNCAKEDQLETL